MSSEGENSKDISAEVDKTSADKVDGNSLDDSQKKEVKAENKEEKVNEKSGDAKASVDKVEAVDGKEKKDAEGKKEAKTEKSDEVKKEEKEKKDKKNDKADNKTDNDTEEGEDSNKEEDEDDDDDDDKEKKVDKKGVPLLDQPLEQSGSRERKKVQRFNEDFPMDAKEAKFEIPSGAGTQLGEIPRIDASISRFKNDDLKLLHRLLFKTPGKTALIKKNIKKFNGFEFTKDSDEYTKKIDSAKKFELKQLKSICEMLDLEKKGVKDEIAQRIIDFLLEPKDSGKGPGRPKRTAAVRANNRGYSSHDDSYSSDERRASRGGRGKGKRSNLKDDTTSESDEDFHPSDASEGRPKTVKRKKGGRKKVDSEDEDENDASEAESPSSFDSDDEPRKRKKIKKVVVNSKGRGRPPGRRGRKPAAETEKKVAPPPAAAAATPTKKNKVNKPESSEESEKHEEENASSSEDEPLIKKAKIPQPPSDEEIKKYVKEILDGANLEEITMKTVCKQVYAHYPDFDLAHKKDFIKSTVKSLIST